MKAKRKLNINIRREEFRALLELYRYSNLWPQMTDENEVMLEGMFDRISQRFGFDSWETAHREL
jgi:hypothetical protein